MNYNVIGIIGNFLLGGEHLSSLVLKKESTKEEEKINLILCLFIRIFLDYFGIYSVRKKRKRKTKRNC